MPKTEPNPSIEITVAEAAALIGVDRKTVLRQIAAGELIPTRKLPGRTGSYLLARSDVQRLAAERVS
ncbi:MAG: helix-turn-helix domain-containing protein [Frankiales bacterium]|nr:helix-turn-helix domain-containing protein [Frankiales bacterium]